jgi:hypothetical protein
MQFLHIKYLKSIIYAKYVLRVEIDKIDFKTILIENHLILFKKINGFLLI